MPFFTTPVSLSHFRWYAYLLPEYGADASVYLSVCLSSTGFVTVVCPIIFSIEHNENRGRKFASQIKPNPFAKEKKCRSNRFKSRSKCHTLPQYTCTSGNSEHTNKTKRTRNVRSRSYVEKNATVL